MTAQAILHDLAARGVRVWSEADNLKLDAPVGTLTDADLANLRALKQELLAALMSKPVSRRTSFREEAEAQQLFEDLRAAGCGISWDGEELRITNLSKLPTVLWMRLENADNDFVRIAREMAESLGEEERNQWVN
jgi:hypothetical protein